MIPYATALGTTAFFAALFIGAGTLVTFRLTDDSSLLERLSLRLALGMVVVPVFQILLHDVLGHRVRPAPAIALGVAGLALLIAERRGRPAAPAEPSARSARDGDMALLLLALAVFLACLRGAQRFPAFEGLDPWGHALGVQYVIDVGVLRQPDPSWPQIQYIDAYPPLYDVLMALPCGLAGSINAPLKAMNALVVGAVLLVFAVFVFRLTGDRMRTLCATVLYAALPGNLTRQVWGHSVAVLFLFAGLAAALRLRDSWRWLASAALCFAGGLLAAPSQGIVNGVLLAAAAVVAVAISRPWALRLAAAGALALAISLIWYGPVLARYGADPVALASAMQHPELRRSGLTAKAMKAREEGTASGVESPYAGSAPRRYGLDDFLFFRPYAFVLKRLGPKQINEIAPEGLGVTVTVLALASLALVVSRRVKREPPGWRELAAVWLGLSLAGLLGPYLGLKFFTWRFWLMVCPFACVAAADALASLAEAPRTRRTAIVTALLLLAAGADTALAVASDASGPGPWRYVPMNAVFLAVPVAATLWLLAERESIARPALVGAVLAMHLLVAGPARLRLLTRYVPPKGFRDEVEHAGYLRVRAATPPGAPVFPLSGGARCAFLIGLDRPCRPYLAEERSFLRRLERTDDPVPTADVVAWLRAHAYRYVVLDPSDKARDPQLFATRVRELDAEWDPLESTCRHASLSIL